MSDEYEQVALDGVLPDGYTFPAQKPDDEGSVVYNPIAKVGRGSLLYRNTLNNVDLSVTSFSYAEQNLFFMICMAARGQDITQGISITFKQIKDFLGAKDQRDAYVESYLKDKIIDKLLNFKIYISSKDGLEGDVIVFFQRLHVSAVDRTLRFFISKDAQDLIEFSLADGGFTTIDFYSEFSRIRSAYNKTLYRHMKQWKSVGSITWSLAELQAILHYPAEYNMKIKKLREKILTPARDTLSEFFEGLKFEYVHKDPNDGRLVSHIKATFRPEKGGKKKQALSEAVGGVGGETAVERIASSMGISRGSAQWGKALPEIEKWMQKWRFTEKELLSFCSSAAARAAASPFAWVAKCVENAKGKKSEEIAAKRDVFYRARVAEAERVLSENEKKMEGVEKEALPLIAAARAAVSRGDMAGADSAKEMLAGVLAYVGLVPDDVLYLKRFCERCSDTGRLADWSPCSCYDEWLAGKR